MTGSREEAKQTAFVCSCHKTPSPKFSQLRLEKVLFTSVNGLLMTEPEGNFGLNSEVSSVEKHQQKWAFY